MKRSGGIYGGERNHTFPSSVKHIPKSLAHSFSILVKVPVSQYLPIQSVSIFSTCIPRAMGNDCNMDKDGKS